MSFAVFSDSADLSVNIINVAPSVKEISIGPSETQKIYKTGSAIQVSVNATVGDNNGVGRIDAVSASVIGPSVIEESPISLTNITNINITDGLYGGSFTLDDGDNTGNYTVNVTVNDSSLSSWSALFFEYLEKIFSVYLNDPENNTEIPGVKYLLDASTNMGADDIEFDVAWAYYSEGSWRCRLNETFSLFCYNDTPGTEFTCLGDFSQDYLNPMDDWLCLKANASDNGNNAVAYSVVHVDNIPPGDISDLSAMPSSTDGSIDISWTAPGENNITGTVSSYLMKIATSEIITEGDFNDAQDVGGDCSSVAISGPGSTQTCTQESSDLPGYVQNSSTTYYYAFKSVDDFGQNSSISNSPGSVAPYHDIEVDTISCVNNKNGVVCNDTTTESTNYLYDIMNISGNISNAGNLNESITVEVKRSSVVVDSKQEYITIGEKKYISGLEWNASYEYPPFTNLELSVYGFSHKKTYSAIKVVSILDNVRLSWYDVSLYPAPTESTPFFVSINVNNTNLEDHFWEIPIELVINTSESYSITLKAPKMRCPDNLRKCYINVTSQDDELAYWQVDDLSSGYYNITVISGENPLDHVSITRYTTFI